MGEEVPVAAARRLEEAGYDSVWLADWLLADIPLRSGYGVMIDVDWSVGDGDRQALEMARDVGF